jgi:hydrogenase/urease accessory protein HupE
MRLHLAWVTFVLLMSTSLASAHEVRPAYLRIADQSTIEQPDRFDVLWRLPVGAEIPLVLTVALPMHCSSVSEPLNWNDGGVTVSKWLSHCPGGLNGHDVHIIGLRNSVTDVLARYERADGTTQVLRMTPTSPAFTITASETWTQVATTYLALGAEHILLGIDHLLFVLALLLIVADWRKLVATITCFTLAHSVTLAAAALGLVNVPQAPVEATIALSIMFVCMEIVHWRDGRPGITRRWPWIVALIFGLLHGFGFAGALSDIGLPEHAIPAALLFFNLGVEVGQLLFIATVLIVWAVLKRLTWPDWAWRIPVYAIGSLAAFWTIDRIAGF